MNVALYTVFDSPLGEVVVHGDREFVAGVYLPGHKRWPGPDQNWRRDDDAFAAAREQLAQYFAGERREFDLPLRPVGTPFQRRVWEELRRIPFGETISYGRLALRVGKPTASRAVGHANGRNPISIVVPCHRVIGSGGALTGYASGLDQKRWLLDWERGANGSRSRTLFDALEPRTA